MLACASRTNRGLACDSAGVRLNCLRDLLESQKIASPTLIFDPPLYRKEQKGKGKTQVHATDTPVH